MISWVKELGCLSVSLTEPQEAASLASESNATRTRCSDAEQKQPGSELEQKRWRAENKSLCAKSLVPLLGAMKDFPTELMQTMIPAGRGILLAMVSKEVRAAMGCVKPAVSVRASRSFMQVCKSRGLANLQESCCVTALDLFEMDVGEDEAGRLAAVLPQCTSLAHLDLCSNDIGAEGAGRLAAVLPQCTSLARLYLYSNDIGAEGAGRLAAVLPQCRSLAHLHLCFNAIGAEGAGQLAAVLPQCRSLAHLDLSENRIRAEGAGLLQAAALPSLGLIL